MEMVVSPSLATRFPVLTRSWGIAWPLAWPDTIDHSPSSWDISGLAASWAPLVPTRRRIAISDTLGRIGSSKKARLMAERHRSPAGAAGETLNPQHCLAATVIG